MASLAVSANTDFVVVELSAELGHVVALDVLLFQELLFGVGIRAIAAELAFAKVNDVLAHFGLPLHFNCLVELLSLLLVSEVLLLLFPGGLAVAVVIFQGLGGLVNTSLLKIIFRVGSGGIRLVILVKFLDLDFLSLGHECFAAHLHLLHGFEERLLRG